MFCHWKLVDNNFSVVPPPFFVCVVFSGRGRERTNVYSVMHAKLKRI